MISWRTVAYIAAEIHDDFDGCDVCDGHHGLNTGISIMFGIPMMVLMTIMLLAFMTALMTS
jgi:hypothetical protein